MNSKMRYIAFSRRANQTKNAMLKEMQKAVLAYKKELRSLPDIQQLNSSKPSELLSLLFGKCLSNIITSAYVDGAYSVRKTPKNRKANNRTTRIQPFADTPDVNKFLEQYLSFDWNLQAINTLRSFTNEAFDYAGVNMANLLDAIKDDAATALANGLSFLDWKEQLTLPGYESANPFHLRTNFDTAANGSFHAAKWHEIQESRELFPYLRYVTIGDDLVREEHQMLEGIVLPIDDPFWTIYYPPNGYNCRCSVEQLMLSEAEADPMFGQKPLTPTLDPRFMHNSGQTDTIFT
jgi:SPP1 gp7 family putative phage head morphogenesis protein